MQTKQEDIWAGAFGDAYVDRNQRSEQLAVKTALFSKILARTSGVTSILELGANVGLNLRAITNILPKAKLSAVEINEKAFASLSEIADIAAWHRSLLGFRLPSPVDLTFTSGVLIHLNPEKLDEAYEALYENSSRYIVISEYYNPTPVTIPYREHTDALFKRDWAGDLMSKYPHVQLVDYGFQYRHDPVFPMDDLTWFLLRKS